MGVTVLVASAARLGVGVGIAMVRVARPELTATTKGGDTASGPGFETAMYTAPACVVAPVAPRTVEEMKLVTSACPFIRTLAPLTNLLPMTCNVNGPTGSGFGLTPVTSGVWLRMVITEVPNTAGLPELVALAVTMKPGVVVAGAV